MIGNCEAIQSLFPRYLRDELTLGQREEVELHTAVCEPCRSALEFERALDMRLSAPVEVPDSLIVKAKARVSAGIKPPSWRERILGRSLMRKMLVSSAAVAALTFVAFALLPTGARAATALQTFRQMKEAMAAAKKHMQIQVKAVITPDGQVQANVTAGDKAGPTPLNVTADVKKDGDKYYVRVNVSFDEGDYAKIAYGKSHDTLVLTPKKQPTMKYEVAIDHKSRLPLAWTAFAKGATDWKKVGAYLFKYVQAPKTG